MQVLPGMTVRRKKTGIPYYIVDRRGDFVECVIVNSNTQDIFTYSVAHITRYFEEVKKTV